MKMTFSVVYFGLLLALILLMVTIAEGTGLRKIKTGRNNNVVNDQSGQYSGSYTTGSFRRVAKNLGYDVSSITAGLGNVNLGISSGSYSGYGYGYDVPYTGGQVYSHEAPPSDDAQNDARLAARKSKTAVIMDEIKTPWTVLSDDVIHRFIKFANVAQRQMPQNMKRYKLLDVSITMIPEECQNHTKTDKDDVQIMYGGAGGDVGCEDVVGHYICVHYVHQHQAVYVYDSLGMKLNSNQKKVLKVLYPNSKLKYGTPKTMQNDFTSCGLFAIAYATTVIFGGDPETYELQLSTKEGVDPSMPLRRHLFNMFKNKSFSIFP
ncbi:uncharacterized protein LOC116337127 isoform X2 [Contarinia nasturtii]|uniref:uncharacterized protein LOC116337127 isoform X2 n=1 Tax=Contarinia nasturtii TaxID=265458 RepID=UPI0012D39050|nr:uncharacterized protein LOC116337127 isoform X2 [Contarinia nasturtii]